MNCCGVNEASLQECMSLGVLGQVKDLAKTIAFKQDFTCRIRTVLFPETVGGAL